MTSSNPSIGGVLTGLGIAPNKLGAVIGVVSKAACFKLPLLVWGVLHGLDIAPTTKLGAVSGG